ncbi:hypothetical protein CYMTET_6863 [Cymbomonas tetramitiformis]|uniref:Uncharacterized protein n=1 Tax=Cymbomonas tetramitiformis TaxID=36881 RepID=A0AAE0GWL8_9CHLO|nr:hypothetical protein CYMTET_6863 [Cymbomonas tetramitiformis]
MDLRYSAYHYDLNAIVFAMLSVVLRGSTLEQYRSMARTHPQDGRAALLRLHYEGDVERLETLVVILEKSAEHSPYEVPLYQTVINAVSVTNTSTFDTVVYRIRRTWQREGMSRLARFPPPLAVDGLVGGGPPHTSASQPPVDAGVEDSVAPEPPAHMMTVVPIAAVNHAATGDEWEFPIDAPPKFTWAPPVASTFYALQGYLSECGGALEPFGN